MDLVVYILDNPSRFYEKVRLGKYFIDFQTEFAKLGIMCGVIIDTITGGTTQLSVAKGLLSGSHFCFMAKVFCRCLWLA